MKKRKGVFYVKMGRVRSLSGFTDSLVYLDVTIVRVLMVPGVMEIVMNKTVKNDVWDHFSMVGKTIILERGSDRTLLVTYHTIPFS